MSIVRDSALAGIVVFILYFSLRHLRRGKQSDYFKLTGVPAPTPLPQFDIDTAKARPYRPFRWTYHQHMALKKMEPDWWIELESTYRERIVQRKALYATHGKKIIDCLPGSEPACRELMEMVIQFVIKRYPNQFRYNSWTGKFRNTILGSVWDVTARGVDPLLFLLENIPEDFWLTNKDAESGLYHLVAAVGCSAVGFNVQEKIGKPLHAIHDPVPDYKEKMQFSMDRYFSKMPCDKPIQRGSWGLEKGQPLFLQIDDPAWEMRAHVRDIEEVHLRVDWQTLRRLPRSRAIVFNFKALFTPIAALRDEPYVPKLLSKVLREGNKEIMEYKGVRHVNHLVIPALEEWAREQEDKGWVSKDWQERTLDEDPFFPGWRDVVYP